MDSITFYLDRDDGQEAEAILHEHVIEDEILSSLTVEDDLAVIRVTGGESPSEPSLVKRVVDPIADAHIHIFDVITSATSVSVFVSWDDREEVLSLVQDQF
jgi:aspartate kinase